MQICPCYSLQAKGLRLNSHHTGLSLESSKEEALQAELSLVQAEEAALPLKIKKLQEALSLETAKLQRREAGTEAHPSLCHGVQRP